MCFYWRILKMTVFDVSCFNLGSPQTLVIVYMDVQSWPLGHQQKLLSVHDPDLANMRCSLKPLENNRKFANIRARHGYYWILKETWKSSLLRVCFFKKIQNWILKSAGILKHAKQILRSFGSWYFKGTEESNLEVDSSVPLTLFEAN